jgi:hypothetical protein
VVITESYEFAIVRRYSIMVAKVKVPYHEEVGCKKCVEESCRITGGGVGILARIPFAWSVTLSA